MGKKGRKKGRGLWGNFPLELFVRITFSDHWGLVKKYLLLNYLTKNLDF